MAWDAIKTSIMSLIKPNGTQAITGQIDQTVLLSMVDALGVGARYMGQATPSTNPGSLDAPVFYITSLPGRYLYLGGIVVNEGEQYILDNTSGYWRASRLSGGSSGGSGTVAHFLGFDTNRSTTRRQIGVSDRNIGYLISYVDSTQNNLFILEEYASLDYSDSAWGADSNWKRVVVSGEVDYASTSEVIVPGRYYVGSDGAQKQVYYRRITGTTAAWTAASSWSLTLLFSGITDVVRWNYSVTPQGDNWLQVNNATLSIHKGNKAVSFLAFSEPFASAPFSIEIEYTK